MIKVCSNCGEENLKQAKYCMFCNNQLVDDTELSKEDKLRKQIAELEEHNDLLKRTQELEKEKMEREMHSLKEKMERELQNLKEKMEKSGKVEKSQNALTVYTSYTFFDKLEAFFSKLTQFVKRIFQIMGFLFEAVFHTIAFLVKRIFQIMGFLFKVVFRISVILLLLFILLNLFIAC